MEGVEEGDTGLAEGEGADQEGGVVQLTMERRRFMAMLAGGVLAAPLAATAQPQAPQRRIGVLLVLLSPTGKEAQAFRKRLHDADYVEGRDVVIEWRSASGDYTRL